MAKARRPTPTSHLMLVCRRARWYPGATRPASTNGATSIHCTSRWRWSEGKASNGFHSAPAAARPRSRWPPCPRSVGRDSRASATGRRAWPRCRSAARSRPGRPPPPRSARPRSRSRAPPPAGGSARWPERDVAIDLRLEHGPGVGAVEQSEVAREGEVDAAARREVGGEVAVVPEQVEVEAVGLHLPEARVAVDLLRPVEWPQADEAPAALQGVSGGPAAGARDEQAAVDLVLLEDLLAPVADRQKVLELGPKVVVEAVAVDEVVGTRTVASGALGREAGVAGTSSCRRR